MKAITIHQPWAMLIALREKHFETRGWPTKYRGSIVIHAGKQIDLQAMTVPEIKNTLIKHGITDWTKLPYGAIVAIANLSEVWKWDNTHGVLLRGKPLHGADDLNVRNIDEKEYVFGYYDDGRYAWELDDIQRLSVPVEAKGQQGLWNWTEER
ncbi:ASCH domain-containing protein [Cohnella cholangitidis]|uniref:ASCH domain-containing protein n=1 Tax=Cohnella cholangitidis TaxID=2598458 RepID=A0A7G5BTE8_9BACL|nr:ASCH domain-containing protein [Cohnella cholangitidis]QMV40232.1 ASCH domain-containing protein [Cohnella cholangitidis]